MQQRCFGGSLVAVVIFTWLWLRGQTVKLLATETTKAGSPVSGSV